jgi:hypothetical protein
MYHGREQDRKRVRDTFDKKTQWKGVSIVSNSERWGRGGEIISHFSLLSTVGWKIG